VKLTANANQAGILTKWAGTVAAACWDLEVTSAGKLAMDICDGAGTEFAIGATTLPTGQWLSCGGRKNGTGAGALQVFLNGASDGSASSVKSIHAGNAPANIGLLILASATALNGLVAEAAVWDAALTDAEFAALAKGVSASKIRPTHLKGYWPLFGTATPEADLSGNGSNMALTGSVPAANHAPVGRLAPFAG